MAGKAGGRAQGRRRDEPVIPQGRRIESARWQKSYGMFITGQSLIDEVRLVAKAMEQKWGAGRLRLVVGAELRDKFDRQRYLFNQAIYFGELEDVRLQAKRMANAWKALDQKAEAEGVQMAPPQVWEHVSKEGVTYAIARDLDEAKAYLSEREGVRVFSLEEICLILDAQRGVGEAKDAFPGAEVVGVDIGAVGDVLGDVEDTSLGLDDPLDDEIPF